jgi:hypothetical protein
VGQQKLKKSIVTRLTNYQPDYALTELNHTCTYAIACSQSKADWTADHTLDGCQAILSINAQGVGITNKEPSITAAQPTLRRSG